jgi:hypothetical protein
VADANDVSGNNNPNGGGTYVGTATTVAGATTTHIADANTVTSGNVDGNEHATATPASPMNNGFGVTFPAPAAGDSKDGGGPRGGGLVASGGSDGASGAGACGHDNSSGGHSGGGNIGSDLVALLRALQQGNTTAINNAVTALGNDVHTDPSLADPHNSQLSELAHHFHHMWA